MSGVEITRAGREGRSRWSVEKAVALELGLSLDEARALLSRLPVTDPRRFGRREEAEAWTERLITLGAEARVVDDAPGPPCVTHERHAGRGRCEACEGAICSLCERVGSRCGACATKARRSRRFFRIRVTFLLVMLAGVLLYAWRDVRSRGLRTDWKSPLRVAIVVVPAEPVEEAALARLSARLDALERRLGEEMRRHGREGMTPFVFTLTATTAMPHPLPRPPEDGASWSGMARFAWDLYRFTSAVDDLAELDGGAFDARIYLVVRAPRGRVRQFEGIGEQGGRIGLVEIDLDEEMADIALFVAAHELFHVLGASDKYGRSGEVLEPDGLADPLRSPLYPQVHTELMARSRPTAPGRSVPPESLDELRVGPATAREIGW